MFWRLAVDRVIPMTAVTWLGRRAALLDPEPCEVRTAASVAWGEQPPFCLLLPSTMGEVLGAFAFGRVSHADGAETFRTSLGRECNAVA